MKISQRNLPAMILSKACLDLGLQEISGDESNPRIDAMFAAVGMDGHRDDTAWCGVVMAYWMRRMCEPPTAHGITELMNDIENWHRGKSPNGAFEFSMEGAAIVMVQEMKSLYIHHGRIIIPDHPE